MKIYKLNKVLHRDFGYFFVAMTLIYAISGIAINHRADWNPNYIITNETKSITGQFSKDEIDMNQINKFLDQWGEKSNYKNHYFPNPEMLRIFINGGSVSVDLSNGETSLETIRPRPILKEVNFLHYNPGKLWTWFSDIFCVALAFLAISGLFILKGKSGLVWRGAILTIAGLIIPLILLFMYL